MLTTCSRRLVYAEVLLCTVCSNYRDGFFYVKKMTTIIIANSDCFAGHWRLVCYELCYFAASNTEQRATTPPKLKLFDQFSDRLSRKRLIWLQLYFSFLPAAYHFNYYVHYVFNVRWDWLYCNLTARMGTISWINIFIFSGTFPFH